MMKGVTPSGDNQPGNAPKISQEQKKVTQGHQYVKIDNDKVALTSNKAEAQSIKEIHKYVHAPGKTLSENEARHLAKMSINNKHINSVEQSNLPPLIKNCLKKTINVLQSAGSFIKNSGVSNQQLLKEIQQTAKEQLSESGKFKHEIETMTAKNGLDKKLMELHSLKTESSMLNNQIHNQSNKIEKIESKINQLLDKENALKGLNIDVHDDALITGPIALFGAILMKMKSKPQDAATLRKDAATLRDEATKLKEKANELEIKLQTTTNPAEQKKINANIILYNKAADIKNEVANIKDELAVPTENLKNLKDKRNEVNGNIHDKEQLLLENHGEQIDQLLQQLDVEKSDSQELKVEKRKLSKTPGAQILNSIVNVNQGFVFVTWNAGTGEEDYHHLFRDQTNAVSTERPSFQTLKNSDLPDDITMMQSINNVRNKLLEETAKDLARMGDVFSLQEVPGNERKDIQAFRQAGFEIIRTPSTAGSNTDTAIAINSKKFKDIENRSIILTSGRDITVAVGIERATGKKIAFVSGHIPGFDLSDPTKIGDSDVGDVAVTEALKAINNKCKDCDSVLMGADMNAMPEKYRNAGVQNDRFTQFENAKFKILRTNEPTNSFARERDGRTATLQERELDYVLLQSNPDLKEVHTGRVIKNLTGPSLTPMNPSDHIPVAVRIQAIQNRAL